MTFEDQTTQPEVLQKSTTPALVSPLPVHVPEPSNIPVLENQMDPVFNDTSTHLEETLPQPDAEPVVNNPEINGNEVPPAVAEPHRDETDPEQSHESHISPSRAENEHGLYQQQQQQAAVDTSNLASTELNEHLNSAQTQPPQSNDQDARLLTNTDTLGGPPSVSLQMQASENPDSAPLEVPNGQTEDLDYSSTEPPNENPINMSNGEVNIQVLLDNLAPPTAGTTQPTGDAQDSGETSGISHMQAQSEQDDATTGAASSFGHLPPRPPPQQALDTYPGPSPTDDIRSFHPHIQTPSGAPSAPTPQSGSYRPSQSMPMPVVAAGAPGTSSQPASGLPPPPVATFQQSPPASASSIPPPQGSPTSETSRQREREEGDLPRHADSEDQTPWGPETQQIYDQFLHDERVYVTEGQWDRFPQGSRLFIGNLPTEKVTKRDLFHIFHRHGKLAQVSIKQAYGFVQFLDSESCYRALQNEQGQAVRGRKMHLEISKPQKSTKARRRSRSPEGKSPMNARGPRGFDRGGMRDRRDTKRDDRDRDDYHSGRNASPYGRDGGYRGGRDGERYGGARRRSRSPSPYRYGQPSRGRSPRGFEDDIDSLPPRDPRNIPDVELILMDDLDRKFIAYIERGFNDKGVKTHFMFLGRIPLNTAVRRQIVDGVLAVAKLTRKSQATGKIPLQVFDRTSGVNNVRFEEYEDLDPGIAAAVVNKAKDTLQAPTQAPFGALPQGYPQQSYGGQRQPSIPNGGGNIANVLSSLDPASLQKLLSSMQQPQQQQSTPYGGAQGAPSGDLASILGGLSRQAQPQSQQSGYPQPQGQGASNPYGNLAANPMLASLLGGAGGAGSSQPRQQQQQQPTQQVQSIMEQLAKWKQ